MLQRPNPLANRQRQAAANDRPNRQLFSLINSTFGLNSFQRLDLPVN
jgi:hypothetical protein